MKISYDQYAYIMGYKKKHTFKKYFCKQTIEHNNNEGHNYHLISRVKPLWFVIICVPINIISFCYALFMVIKQYDEWLITPEAFKDYNTLYAYPTDKPSATNRFLEVLGQYGGYHG